VGDQPTLQRDADSGEPGGLIALASVRQILDALPLPVMAFGGPDHRIVAANEAGRAFFSRGDVVGRTAGEVLPEIVGQRLFDLLDSVYASGEPRLARQWRLQADCRTGEIDEMSVDLLCAPWHAADGSVAGLVIAGTEASRVASTATPQGEEQSGTLARAADGDCCHAAARNVLAELQEALMPAMLPLLRQARLAARYLAAASEHAAGGDWFDAVLLADGVVALIVGDVVGHGVHASAAMGQLRAVLNDRLVANADLADALAEVDVFAARTPRVRAATLTLAALDPVGGSMRYATCGHPPPLIIAADGRTRFLPATGGGPLGTGTAPVFALAALEPGETVLLFSDGLIDQPGRAVTECMTQVARVAADAALSWGRPAEAAPSVPERVCQLTVDMLTRAGYADDVTTLAAQRLAEPLPALQLELPATLVALTTARRALSQWLQVVGAVSEDRAALQLAVAEILLNAVEHAYPPDGPGVIGLDLAVRDDGYVECRIADHGTWRSPRMAGSGRGNGLTLVEHLIDQVLVSHPPQISGVPRGTRGTMVTLRHRFRSPAVLAGQTSARHHDHEAEQPFSVRAALTEALAGDAANCPGDESVRVVVTGVVDVFAAEQLSRELLTLSGGGTLPLRVDLTAVAQLASAGVSSLFRVRQQLNAQLQNLVLIAEPDSNVAAVLDLVALPYQPAGAD